MSSWLQPVVLQGSFVRLEPVRLEHAAALAPHAQSDLFRYFLGLQPKEPTKEALESFIEQANKQQNELTFAIIINEANEPIGTTSYLDAKPEHRAVEIGRTWIAKPHQATKVNPEIKLLMLRHGFTQLDCVRVQLKTDARNAQSRRAIEKLGASFEGILRAYGILPNGHIRDTAMYSILPKVWPEVERALLKRLES